MIEPHQIIAQQGKTRSDIVVPAWVENAMYGGWAILVIAGIAYLMTDSAYAWIIGVVAFFVVGRIVYVRYRKEDPVSAEIAFNNETDGFNSGGDGDGDGGGD